MPTYEYRCQTCGVRFDVRQSITEESLMLCPEPDSSYSPSGCQAPGLGKVSKVFFAPSITFKGSGFYKTDSRAAAGKAAASTNGKGANGKGQRGGDKVATGASDSSSASSGNGGGDGSSAGAPGGGDTPGKAKTPAGGSGSG